VAHAVAAANFKVDCPGFTTARLIASLSDYDPVVRHYAAIELGKRTLGSTDLTTLRNMVTGADANGRMGACQALGLLKDSTALPAIVQRLDKSTETDLWVRAKAASAIRSYTSATASTHRDTMLTAFTANATDPDVIVWEDPIQMSNNFLSLALFGDAIYGGGNIRDYTINAPKEPALSGGPDRFATAGLLFPHGGGQILLRQTPAGGCAGAHSRLLQGHRDRVPGRPDVGSFPARRWNQDAREI
jgi:hypothetical protein